MNLIADMSNLCWIMRFGLLKDKTKRDPLAKEVIMQYTLTNIIDVYKKYNCNNLILAFDCKGNNWRKSLYEGYKANRDTDYDMYYEEVHTAINELKSIFSTTTNAYCVEVDKCEADDVVACVSVLSKDPSVIYSTDKDFCQLVSEKVKVFNPLKKEERTSDNKEFDLFEKCIRGDKGDNILSAYPRVRKTKLLKAFEDKYEMANLMNERLKDGTLVKDNYEFNRDLIDFDRMPVWVVNSVMNRIVELQDDLDKNPKYDYIKCLRAFRDSNLKNVALNIVPNTVFMFKNFKKIL